MRYRVNLLGAIEQALKGLQGYGIMALELIQNADDAGSKSLSIDARDEALVVCNDSSFTTCGLLDEECPWAASGDPSGLIRPCNFHAIVEMASRSKVPAAEQIGRFGIGFVSVYQITDTPIIRSSGIELQLNPKTQEVTKREIVASPGSQFVLPWASTESDVRRGLNASPTPVDVADKVISEAELVLQESLLFLRHVETVELRRNGTLLARVEIDRSGENVALRFEPSGITQQWFIIARAADDVLAAKNLFKRFEALTRLDRSTKVSVAVPVNLEKVDGLLYAYLPTRQSSGMPIHINADFFPHASRQAIVLEGEQHERYWNEALIETAAAAVADNFVRLRDLLGAIRFWALAEAAFQRKGEPAFQAFWEKFGTKAKETGSVWTTQEEWRIPSNTALPPDSMTADDQTAIAELGLPIIHSELRRHWTVMSSIGAQQLRLSGVVTVLESLGADATRGGADRLRQLWSAIDLLISVSTDRVGLNGVLERLKKVPFMLDLADRPASPEAVRRLPETVSADMLQKFVPLRRIMNHQLLKFTNLVPLVGEYVLNDLASDLGGLIVDEASARSVIGESDGEVRQFYVLLTSFPSDRGSELARMALEEVPLLRTGTGFVSPSRGQLPGDFLDPIGHFQIVETHLFVSGMDQFAKKVLQVRVLTFQRYIVDHLEQIIVSGVTKQQYRALLAEIIKHRSELDQAGAFEALSDIAFVRTRAGTWARPADVYFWAAPLASILGEDESRWVDEEWLPEVILARARDVYEALGMPFTVAAEHIVERLTDIGENDDNKVEEIAAATAPIIRYVLERWMHFDEDDREVLSQLQDVAFLTAVIDGKLDEEHRYEPTDVYRAGRAAGFASQVPVVEMPALRATGPHVTDFLDLIGMPSEPLTKVIVEHLENCMATGTQVNDLTYVMLNERLERSDGVAAIDRLLETDFIYVNDVGFIGAGEVFWIPQAFGAHWHAANAGMRRREQLYRHLGVVDSPEPRHFAALALKISSEGHASDADCHIHSRCIMALAEALEREDAGAVQAVDMLVDTYAFLDLNGDPIWTGDAIWLDSEQLAAPFGSELYNRLIRLDGISRAAASRFVKRVNVPALTDIACFALAQEPDGRISEEATTLLQNRADLILWLAPNRAARKALNDILPRLEIRLSDRLMVQAEIGAFDPPVRSPETSTSAYLDPHEGRLHLRSTTGRVEWTSAFRAIFAEVERFCPTAEIPPLCMTAAHIMSQAEWIDAEQMLRETGFKAPEDDYQIEVGPEIQDTSEGEYPGEHDMGSEEVTNSDSRGSEASCESGDVHRKLAPGGERPSTRQEPQSDFIGNGRDDGDDGSSDASAEPVGRDHLAKIEPEGSATDDEGYGSASSRGGFGDDPPDQIAASSGKEAHGEHSKDTPGGSPHGLSSAFGRKQGDARHETSDRQVRRSRMLAYVARGASHGQKDAPNGSSGEDITSLIDAAAMKAALNYERARGREPEQQPQLNRGFDIISRSSAGKRRLIEVKGLENEWTERGIKLSHVQFAMAREHPDEFWIYVVENVRDMERQRVTAIGNPFSKVEEYWFDHNWRDASEEKASSREINLNIGLKVRHALWGRGTIVEIKSRGAIPFVVVDFGAIEGRRGLPFNSSLQVVD